VEIPPRSGADGGRRGRALEDILQVVIVIDVETAEGQHFLGTLHSASHETVLSTGVRFQRQTTVGPQLSLAAETIRRLHQGDQLSHSKRTQAGDAEPLTGRMFPTLSHQLSLHSPVQSSQEVELFIELLGSTPHASF